MKVLFPETAALGGPVPESEVLFPHDLAPRLVAVPEDMTTLERLWARTVVDGECWRWTGAHISTGYGSMRHDGRVMKVHRVAFELLVRPLEDGEEVDHLCRVRDCWRPEHLEAVSRTENIRRSVPYRTHREVCKSGLHPMEGENLYVGPRGQHRCRACAAETSRKFRQRNPTYHYRYHPPKGTS